MGIFDQLRTVIQYSTAALMMGATFGFAADLNIVYDPDEDLSARQASLLPDLPLDEKYDACDAVLTGSLQDGDLIDFAWLFDYSVGEDYNTYNAFRDDALLCLDSQYGNYETALDIVQFLQQLDVDLQTTVLAGDSCEDACVLLFLAGSADVEGSRKMRSIQPGANLKIGQPTMVLESINEQFPEVEEIELAHTRTLTTISRIYDMVLRTDGNGSPYMTPYLFQIMLSVDPGVSFAVDRVGDALLGDIAVEGVRLNVTLDEDLIETICDNVFMAEDQMLNWDFGPSWKPAPVLSAHVMGAMFNQKLDEVRFEYDIESEFNTDVQIVHTETETAGFKRGYPVSPSYTQDCLVRIGSGDRVGKHLQLANLQGQWNANISGYPIQVRSYMQHLADTHETRDLDPVEYWNYTFDNADWRLTGAQSYRPLIAFPFDMPLTQLATRPAPEPESEEAEESGTAFVDMSCDELWYERNAIFHQHGYCFASERGKRVFGNEDCYTSAPDIKNMYALLYLDSIKAAEAKKQCN